MAHTHESQDPKAEGHQGTHPLRAACTEFQIDTALSAASFAQLPHKSNDASPCLALRKYPFYLAASFAAILALMAASLLSAGTGAGLTFAVASATTLCNVKVSASSAALRCARRDWSFVRLQLGLSARGRCLQLCSFAETCSGALGPPMEQCRAARAGIGGRCTHAHTP